MSFLLSPPDDSGLVDAALSDRPLLVYYKEPIVQGSGLKACSTIRD